MDQALKTQWKQHAAVCGWYISYLYRKSFSEMNTSSGIGISGNQSIVLVGIYRNEGTNQRTLADTIAMMPSVMSRILRELEDAGYVEKRRDEQNSLRFQQAYWQHILQDLTFEETTQLNELLEKLELRAGQPFTG